MVRDQVSTEGVIKWLPVALKVHLGEEQNNMQERCRAATTNSLYAKAYVACGELNLVNG